MQQHGWNLKNVMQEKEVGHKRLYFFVYTKFSKKSETSDRSRYVVARDQRWRERRKNKLRQESFFRVRRLFCILILVVVI